MIRLSRIVAIFVLLFFATSAAFRFGLPRLIRWHFAYCMGNDSAVCSTSAAFLSYWWLAVLPVLVATTLLVDRVFAKGVQPESHMSASGR